MSKADYRVSIKVRNANLLRAIERVGLAPGRELAEQSRVGYGQINDLLNMTTSPLTTDGRVRPYVDRLLVFLGASFDEVFSHDQCEALETNKTERDLSAEQVFGLMHQDCCDDPLNVMLGSEAENDVQKMLAGLTEQQREVVERRFGLCGEDPETLRQIADSRGVTPARIAQIEAKAFRGMRRWAGME